MISQISRINVCKMNRYYYYYYYDYYHYHCNNVIVFKTLLSSCATFTFFFTFQIQSYFNIAMISCFDSSDYNVYNLIAQTPVEKTKYNR